MVAAVTAQGGHAAIVGQPDIGLLAAVEMGADLSRIAVIPEPGADPAQRPLIEGGEGVAEGFELAEQDLEEAASHGDSAVPRPEREAEDDRIDPTYGEADDVIPQGEDSE